MQLPRVLFGAVVALGYFSSLAGAQIKIGVAEALTGNAAQYGVPIRKGFELALERDQRQRAVSTARRSSWSSKTSRAKRKKRSTSSRS